ncbi:MAG: MazG family protein [Propionibacteriaceae bacterium]|jgi:XTP/dITP diphosphohydrolase|nr:MazG family protein [Propionibacteriaceae bacterium]
MRRLRRECPWDAEQTHLTLANYLVEETGELLDAIEAGNDADLVEELGDVLLQVAFHCEIASQQGRFDIEDVARGVADKLISRHPYIYADGDVPADLMVTWEQNKQAEKRRTSALDGIPERMSALARAHKDFSRAVNHGHDLACLGVVAADADPAEIGQRILALVALARETGVDPDQATRQALRAFETRLVNAESDADPAKAAR